MRSESEIRGALITQRRMRQQNKEKSEETASKVNREIYQLAVWQLEYNIRILEWVLEERD